MTTSDLPAEGQPDVSADGTEAPFDDVITPLTVEEIDDLCERLNAKENPDESD